MSIPMSENKIQNNATSFTDFLFKKEGKGKWVRYWVILDENYLKFYESNKSEELLGSIEINSKSKCVVSKRKTYSFPFALCAAHGRHLFKCESAARRHRWMTVINQASDSLRFPISTEYTYENDFRINDLPDKEIECVEESENDDDVLPTDVLLVAPVSTTTSSPPFKLRNRMKETPDKRKECKDDKTSGFHQSIVYPFDRNTEESVKAVSDLERKQFSSLNIRLAVHNDLASPRSRSVPSTPMKDDISISPLTSDSSLFGKSRSLTSLTSPRTDMRFSRHMISGLDDGDIEV